MSRWKIGVGVTVAIAALTFGLYYVTSSTLAKRIQADVGERVGKAQQLLVQNSSLEGLSLMKRAEVLARDPLLPAALDEANVVQRAKLADTVFKRHLAELKTDEPKPDFLALVDDTGKVAAMLDVPRPDPEDWKTRFPAVQAALEKRLVTKDVWDYRNGVMKVGVAPVYDPDTASPMGALIVAYALNSAEAKSQSRLLGVEVGYVFGGAIHATSFQRGGGDEDVDTKLSLSNEVNRVGLIQEMERQSTATPTMHMILDGKDYLMSAARLPLNFHDKTGGAMVMMSLTDAMAPIATIRTGFVLLGAACLIIALLAMLFTARTILAPAEEIELGITEIINGEIDYTFKPAGADFDGMANALNVMLARLLGRPEPGEEEYDDAGNIVGEGKLSFEDVGIPGGKVATDADTLALANEAEPDYYKRLFQEYVAARKAAGDASVDGVRFENFVAKVRLSEANLKKKYSSKAVRFRVQTQDKTVSLKPVPIL